MKSIDLVVNANEKGASTLIPGVNTSQLTHVQLQAIQAAQNMQLRAGQLSAQMATAAPAPLPHGLPPQHGMPGGESPQFARGTKSVYGYDRNITLIDFCIAAFGAALPPGSQPHATVYVGSLQNDLSETDVRTIFEPIGRIKLV
jgi:hypothetical protein